MKRLTKRAILKSVDIGIQLFCGAAVFTFITIDKMCGVYDWALGGELSDIDEVIKPKPKPGDK